jgi:hypothetical protein
VKGQSVRVPVNEGRSLNLRRSTRAEGTAAGLHASRRSGPSVATDAPSARLSRGGSAANKCGKTPLAPHSRAVYRGGGVRTRELTPPFGRAA